MGFVRKGDGQGEGVTVRSIIGGVRTEVGLRLEVAVSSIADRL